MKRTWVLCLCLLPVATIAAAQQVPGAVSPADPSTDIPYAVPQGELTYGFGLQIDMPFQKVGGTAVATVLFFNMSSQDAYGYVPVGGEGCSFFVNVRDDRGRLVRRPLVPCPMMEDPAIAPVGPWKLAAGTFLSHDVPISLEYIQSETGDHDGEPLPGGLYTLESWHFFEGPRRQNMLDMGPGGKPEASIPFRISACSKDTGDRRIRSLERGSISGYRYGDPEFYGEDLVFRTRPAFRQFWKQHAGIWEPAPRMPEVDFDTEMVIATVMGYQPMGGSTTSVSSVDERRCRVEVSVSDVYFPGLGPAEGIAVLTNPYHIVAVPRSMKEPVFQHFVAWADSEPAP
jgi:hypothetical protein